MLAELVDFPPFVVVQVLEGEDAVRGLLQTEEYVGLKELATSMVVEIP